MVANYSNLWRILDAKSMNKSDLRRAAEISPNTITKLRRQETVSLDVLMRICGCLDCNLGDICHFSS